MFIKNKIKQILLLILKKFISLLPITSAGNLLIFIHGKRPGLANSLLISLSPEDIQRKTNLLACSLELMTRKDENKYKIEILDAERYESISLPVVYGLSSGGEISLFKKEISLFKFENAIFHPMSDIVRVGNKAYWDKFDRPQFIKMIASDRDLISCNVTLSRVLVTSYPIQKKISVGFSLAGVHVNSWGHFIANFLPKLRALQFIKNEPELKIILPNIVDDHIKELVALCLKSIGDFEVVFVNENELVNCDKLYYCNATSFLSDNGSYIHPADIQITKYSIEALYHLVNQIKPKNSSTPDRKLFIGRRGLRNIKYYFVIEEHFRKLGFDIIFPHLLSFTEKVRLFNQASHVCGPYSSGFANIIFCQPDTKVLAFSNFARTLDSYISAIGVSHFNLKVSMLTGVESTSSDPHNSYEISLDRIKECLQDIKFF